jgi:hypothetical protein
VNLFLSDGNSFTPIRLFGQFKQNGFGFNNLSTSTFGQVTSKEKPDDDHNSPSTYFTNSLSKISSTINSGFGSSSTPLAASLASLGAKYEDLNSLIIQTILFLVNHYLVGLVVQHQVHLQI